MKLRRSVSGQYDFFVNDTRFMGEVMSSPVPLVCQPFAAPIGGSGNSRTAHAPLDDLNEAVKDCYVIGLLPSGGYRPAETEQTQSGCFVFAGAHGVWGRYFPIASAGRNKPQPGVPAQAQRSGLRGERRSKGADAVFAAGGNGVERTLRRRAHGTGHGV